MIKRGIGWMVWGLALCGGVLNAATVFNFDSDVVNTQTTFTDTAGGLSVTFSSPADPGGFRVFGTVFSSLTGNVLLSPGSALVDNIPLTLTFNAQLSDISLLFALNAGANATLDFQAFNGATLVGSGSAGGAIPNGFFFPEGMLSFSSAPFDSLLLSTSAPNFAIDSVSVTAVPEPASWISVGLGLGLVGFVVQRLRRGSNRAFPFR